MSRLTAGTSVGPYEIVEAIGSGGMGEVYRARDARLNRDVAIKILPSHAEADPHGRQRFERETRAVAALSHPNIVAIYDVGTQDGMPYAAIELLDGLALRVMSRAAVAKFKDVKADLAAMVGELGVGSVVTGTVREDAGRVRVNVDLIDARSGQLIWSEQYDREATEVFAVQSDIALRVSDALKASVTLDEQARASVNVQRPASRPTNSSSAGARCGSQSGPSCSSRWISSDRRSPSIRGSPSPSASSRAGTNSWRIRRAADAAPEDLEVLLARSELATLAGSPDASRFTQPLLADLADAPAQLTFHAIKLLHAFQLHMAGQKVRAAALMNEILAANQEAVNGGADWLLPPLQNASIDAIRGDSKSAVDALERAYAAGWKDARTTRLNPMWASLRREPRFEQLVARMDADVAAMRGRADYSRVP